MLHLLGKLLIIVVVGGILAWLLGKASFIKEEYRGIGNWLILVVVVLGCLSLILGALGITGFTFDLGI